MRGAQATSRPSIDIGIGLILILGTLAAFAPTLAPACGFVNYDDDIYVSRNPHVLDGLSAGNVIWAFATTEASNWHPLTWLSLQLDASLGGSRPLVFHLSNLCLHVASVLLLYALLYRSSGARWPSALVAALFAWH